MFFLDRFSLADPETFRLACPVDDVDRACGSMSAVALERLSHLSDVVESALVSDRKFPRLLATRTRTGGTAGASRSLAP